MNFTVLLYVSLIMKRTQVASISFMVKQPIGSFLLDVLRRALYDLLAWPVLARLTYVAHTLHLDKNR